MYLENRSNLYKCRATKAQMDSNKLVRLLNGTQNPPDPWIINLINPVIFQNYLSKVCYTHYLTQGED